MKRITILTALFIALIGLTFTGCPSPVPPKPAGETVSAMPILAGGSSIVASKNISVPYDPKNQLEFAYTNQGPILSGWETGTFEVGKEYTSKVNGATVKTVASIDASGNTVYTGTFDDNKGTFVVTLKTNDTWEYTQSLVTDIVFSGDIAVPDGTVFMTLLSQSSVSGSRDGLNLTGTNGESYCYQNYLIGDRANARDFFSYDFSLKIRDNGAFVGQLVTGQVFKSTDAGDHYDATLLDPFPAPAYDNATITAYEAGLTTGAMTKGNTLIYRVVSGGDTKWYSVNVQDGTDNPEDAGKTANEVWELHP